MDFPGKIRRSLDERKFNSKSEIHCATGGVTNGCPFLRLKKTGKRICILYRLFPKWNEAEKKYERIDVCLNNEQPPVKKSYIVHYSAKKSCEIIGICKEEVVSLFNKNHNGEVIEIVEGKEIDYEYAIYND